jgi:hypothetical protein
MKTVFLVVLALAALYLLVTLVLFELVCRRFPKAIDPFRKLTHATDALLKPYGDCVSQGKAFLAEHPGQSVTITSFDGLTLHGTFYEKEPESPLLIACHGYRSNGVRDFATACPYYYGKGFSLLLIDQRAAGESQGRYLTLGIKEHRDVLAWCEFVQREHPGCPVVLAGISMGASSVLMAADKVPDNVVALLADCGYVSAWDELAYVVHHNAHLPAGWLLWGVDLWCHLLGGFGLKTVTTTQALAGCTRPVFLIHGQADQLVPFENSLKNHRACGASVSLFSVPQADHGISYLVDGDGYHTAADTFFQEVLASAKNKPL